MTDTLIFICRAWKMWNTWLAATERSEIEFDHFVKLGFSLKEGKLIGRDGMYDVEIGPEQIYISIKGRPRYRWFPHILQMGNLNYAEEDLRSRSDLRAWLQSFTLD